MAPKSFFSRGVIVVFTNKACCQFKRAYFVPSNIVLKSNERIWFELGAMQSTQLTVSVLVNWQTRMCRFLEREKKMPCKDTYIQECGEIIGHWRSSNKWMELEKGAFSLQKLAQFFTIYIRDCNNCQYSSQKEIDIIWIDLYFDGTQIGGWFVETYSSFCCWGIRANHVFAFADDVTGVRVEASDAFVV